METPWYDQSETSVDGTWKVPPYGNFFIGSDPTAGMASELSSQFQAFVNVSDNPCATFNPPSHKPAMYWHSLDEWGDWGYTPFFWSKKILDYHHSEGHKIYLHCQAGRHRSPMIFLQWLLSRGHRIEEAAKLTFTNKQEAKHILYMVHQDIVGGHIPNNIPELHKRMTAYPEKSMSWILTHPTPISK